MAERLCDKLFEGFCALGIEVDVVLGVKILDPGLSGKGSINNDVVHAGSKLSHRHPLIGLAEDVVDNFIECEYSCCMACLIEDNGNTLVVALELL